MDLVRHIVGIGVGVGLIGLLVYIPIATIVAFFKGSKNK